MRRQDINRVFRPRLLDALQGYDRERLIKDVGAGVTVGIVALPLAMAFAIASGLKPEAGLFTAIIAGFLISALGGSRVQIGGPAGAFIVVVYGIVEHYGVANLLVATAMAGVLLLLMGLFRLGTLIRFIPIAVVIGFTNGIATLIILSQVKDFLGLRIEAMPAHFFGMAGALMGALPTLNPYALALALGSLALVVGWQQAAPKLAPKVQFSGRLSAIPGSIVALAAATVVTLMLDLPVETIGKRFGGIAAGWPTFAWPDFSWDTVRFLLMPALTIALLGAIESLLCARIADGMIADRHNPNQELMAQGIANLVTPFFGGMPATGTIARTVTNIKSGATSPVSGIVHALTLLIVVLLAAPLAAHVPLPALAALLVYVGWNMGEWREFAHLGQYRLPYRAILLAVFGLTVVFDLTVAVEVGLVAACLTFIYRISSLTRAEAVPLTVSDAAARAYSLHGALFFGAVRLIEEMHDLPPTRVLVLDFEHVIYLDSSAIDTLLDLLRAARRRGARLVLCGLRHQPQDVALRCGMLAEFDAQDLHPDLAAALAAIGAKQGPERA